MHAVCAEAVGYESGACYLAEEDALGALGALGAMGAAAAGALRCRARALAAAEGAQAEWRGARARHASDGDILAPALRPESGAFSGNPAVAFFVLRCLLGISTDM